MHPNEPDLPEELREALKPVVEKYEQLGWRLMVWRPRGNQESASKSVRVWATSPNGETVCGDFYETDLLALQIDSWLDLHQESTP